MKVKKIIELLSNYDPETEIFIEDFGNKLLFVSSRVGFSGILLEGKYGKDLSDELQQRFKYQLPMFKSISEFVQELLDTGFTRLDIEKYYPKGIKYQEYIMHEHNKKSNNKQ